jgi:hypothetical protein
LRVFIFYSTTNWDFIWLTHHKSLVQPILHDLEDASLILVSTSSLDSQRIWSIDVHHHSFHLMGWVPFSLSVKHVISLG